MDHSLLWNVFGQTNFDLILVKLNLILLQDEEDQVYRRDITNPTLEDHFDKTVLPKVMQVKNFGRSGRTKYTHLVDQDTTSVIL